MDARAAPRRRSSEGHPQVAADHEMEEEDRGRPTAVKPNRARIRERIKRIQSTRRMRVVDLFAGCGGFSLGFQRAGFDVLGGLELDPLRAQSFICNFRSDLRGHPDVATDLTSSPFQALR